MYMVIHESPVNSKEKLVPADIQRRDCILACSVILSFYGADPIAKVKLLISPFLRWSHDLWNQLLGF